MVQSRILAGRVRQHACTGHSVKTQIVIHLLHQLRFHRTHPGVAAVPARRAAVYAGEGTAGNTSSGEKEFGPLQRKGSSRLHRFYVSHPLGPTARSPSLDSLLADSLPANQPAARATLASSPAPSATADAAPSPTLAASGSAGTGGEPPATVMLEGEEARHAARALRLQSGDRVELCDGRGNLLEGVVSGSDKQRVWVAPDGPLVNVAWRGNRWVVAVACTTLKGGRAEWLVEKLTELGAYMMVPLVTERSREGGKAKFRTRGSMKSRGSTAPATAAAAGDSDGDSDGDYQPGRLERVAIAATKQSLRPHALHLAPPTALADVLPLVRRTAGACSSSDGSDCGLDIGPAWSSQGLSAQGLDQVSTALRGAQSTVVKEEEECGDHSARRAELGGGSGGGSFCLVAVAGAPPLAAVLRDVRGRKGGLGSAALHAGAAEYGDAHADRRCDGEGILGGACTATEGPIRLLFIGPEGDFTPAELAALVQGGARPVGLGANRLRTETAAVALLAACLLTEEGADDN